MKDSVDWYYAKIEEFAYLTKGRTPARAHKEYYASVGVPWVKIENLKRRVVYTSEEYLSETGERQGKTVPQGSVLLSVNRTIGKVGIAGVPLQTNEQIIAITCKESEGIWAEYLYYYLMFSEKILQRRAYVTVSSRISMDMLKNIIVPIPQIEYQKYIAEKLQVIEELVWKKEEMVEILKKYLKTVHNGEDKPQRRERTDRGFSTLELSEIDELLNLLQQSVQLAQRLLKAVLNHIFLNAEIKKEAVYYGKRDRKWYTVDEIWQLDENMRMMLKKMSLFQQSLYCAFYTANKPSAIHTILKQIKQVEPAFELCNIQDAVNAVENFRQIGLLAQQEKRKLYYTEEQTETNEILKEDGSNLTISLWGCTFPN